MASPAKQNLTVTRGDTLTLVVTMTTDGSTPVNITGRTYAAQIRTSSEATSATASFTCTITDGANGVLTCTVPASTTSSLSPVVYVWDLQETASGVVSTLLSGTVTVVADITR